MIYVHRIVNMPCCGKPKESPRTPESPPVTTAAPAKEAGKTPVGGVRTPETKTPEPKTVAESPRVGKEAKEAPVETPSSDLQAEKKLEGKDASRGDERPPSGRPKADDEVARREPPAETQEPEVAAAPVARASAAMGEQPRQAEEEEMRCSGVVDEKEIIQEVEVGGEEATEPEAKEEVAEERRSSVVQIFYDALWPSSQAQGEVRDSDYYTRWGASVWNFDSSPLKNEPDDATTLTKNAAEASPIKPEDVEAVVEATPEGHGSPHSVEMQRLFESRQNGLQAQIVSASLAIRSVQPMTGPVTVGSPRQVDNEHHFAPDSPRHAGFLQMPRGLVDAVPKAVDKLNETARVISVQV